MVTQALHAVAKLAREVEAGLPVGRGVVTVSDTGDVNVRRPADPSRHHFFLDGLLFRVSLTPRDDGTTRFQIWAEVGYLPYSIESPEKRARLLTILRATQWLEDARFVLDESQKILVLGQRDIQGHATLSDLMYELVQFLQQARPYLRVMGQYI